MSKKCAVCGERLGSDAIDCPKCGRGVFASEKEHYDSMKIARRTSRAPDVSESYSVETPKRISFWKKLFTMKSQPNTDVVERKKKHELSLETRKSKTFDLHCIQCGGELYQNNIFVLPITSRSPEDVTHLICRSCFGGVDHSNNDLAMRFIMWKGELDQVRIRTKYITALRCPYCDKVAPPRRWPVQGDSIPFYCYTVEQARKNPGKGEQVAICADCKKLWYVVWDQDPNRTFL